MPAVTDVVRDRARAPICKSNPPILVARGVALPERMPNPHRPSVRHLNSPKQRRPPYMRGGPAAGTQRRGRKEIAGKDRPDAREEFARIRRSRDRGSALASMPCPDPEKPNRCGSAM